MLLGSSSTPPIFPQHLYVRLSDARLALARYDQDVHTAFAFSTYHLDPKFSLTTNLREASQTEALLRAPYKGTVQILVSSPTTFVPLAEFQEEDAKAIYDFCIPPTEKRRVFYDIVPSANCVVLFSLKETIFKTLNTTFPQSNFISSVTPLLRHFSQKGISRPGQTRIFVYAHNQSMDLSIFEDTRLIMANSYPMSAPTDVAYFTFNLTTQLGIATAPTAEANSPEEVLATSDAYPPIYVVAAPGLQENIVETLREFASNVIAVNPTGEFNRHVVASTPGVPYDLITLMIGNSK